MTYYILFPYNPFIIYFLSKTETGLVMVQLLDDIQSAEKRVQVFKHTNLKYEVRFAKQGRYTSTLFLSHISQVHPVVIHFLRYGVVVGDGFYIS